MRYAQFCEETSLEDDDFAVVKGGDGDSEIPAWFQSWISDDAGDSEKEEGITRDSSYSTDIEQRSENEEDLNGSKKCEERRESKQESEFGESEEDIHSEDERRPSRRSSESADGYEMRGQYWEAMPLLNCEMARALDEPESVYDCMELPPSGLPKTERIRQLCSYSIKRAWKRRRFQTMGRVEVKTVKPDLRDAVQVEAVMIYERGNVRTGNDQCSYCISGRGISAMCVSMPTGKDNAAIGDGICSNCFFNGSGATCNRIEGVADVGEEKINLGCRHHSLNLENMLGQAKLVEAAAQHFAEVMKQWTATLERKKQQE